MLGISRESSQVRTALAARGESTAGLLPVGTRPPLGTYLRQLWQRRHFIRMDARERLLTQNRRFILGNAWLVLRPLLDAVFYFMIFGVVLNANRGIDNYPAYIVIGVLLFSSTSRVLTSGAGIIQQGRATIRAFAFPRAAIPLSLQLQDTLESLPTLAVMLIFITALPPHELPSATWLLLVPIVALQWVMDCGIRLILARVGFHVPDIAQIMSFTARILLYGSAVIFPIDRFVDHPVAITIIEANPVYRVVSMARTVLMDGQVPSLTDWAVLAGWAVGLAVVGFVFFWRGEARYGGGE